MANLFNFKCPKCGDTESLVIEAITTIKLFSDGTEPVDGTHEWTDESVTSCGHCEWTGTVKELEVEN